MDTERDLLKTMVLRYQEVKNPPGSSPAQGRERISPGAADG
jgi:hypothetical protein